MISNHVALRCYYQSFPRNLRHASALQLFDIGQCKKLIYQQKKLLLGEKALV